MQLYLQLNCKLCFLLCCSNVTINCSSKLFTKEGGGWKKCDGWTASKLVRYWDVTGVILYLSLVSYLEVLQGLLVLCAAILLNNVAAVHAKVSMVA